MPELNESITAFYLRCYNDADAQENYYRMINHALVVHGGNLTSKEKADLEKGDPFEVDKNNKVLPRQSILLAFYNAVNADTVLKNGFDKYHDEMIEKYGKELSDPQKAMIRDGKASDISTEIANECGIVAVIKGGSWTLKP